MTRRMRTRRKRKRRISKRKKEKLEKKRGKRTESGGEIRAGEDVGVAREWALQGCSSFGSVGGCDVRQAKTVMMKMMKEEASADDDMGLLCASIHVPGK